MEKELFKQFEDLIKIGQKEIEFDVPGAEKTHKIKLGVLWQKDLITIKTRTAEKLIFPGDSEARQVVEPLETLVESILVIDGENFYDETDTSAHNLKKAQLRNVLECAHPGVINFIYQKYVELSRDAYNEITEKVEALKKSSGSSQENKKTQQTPNLD
jgi:hypothetical protein